MTHHLFGIQLHLFGVFSSKIWSQYPIYIPPSESLWVSHRGRSRLSDRLGLFEAKGHGLLSEVLEGKLLTELVSGKDKRNEKKNKKKAMDVIRKITFK